jgi:hypothetical protein
MDAFMGLATIDKATLSSWRAILEEQVAWCRARGIAYLPVIAPNKEGIYPEFLPFAEQHLRAPRNRCDDFVAAISPVMPLGVMDLRPVLIQAKGEGQLYYKTDTHWTSLGAFLAVQAIHDRLHTAFPRLPRLERSDFVTRSKEFSGDIAAMAQLRDRYRETVDSLVPTRAFPAHSQAGTPVLGNDPAAAKADEPIGPNASGIAAVAENADSQLPTCILFCDSFGDGMVPYLEQCFRRFIHVRSSFDRAVVERERPDVVIQEFAERYLDRVAGDSH